MRAKWRKKRMRRLKRKRRKMRARSKMSGSEWKAEKEVFVSHLNGTSLVEAQSLLLVPPFGLLVHVLILSLTPVLFGSSGRLHRCIDFTLCLTPIACFCFLPWPWVYAGIAAVLPFCIHVQLASVAIQPAVVRSALHVGRGMLLFTTCLTILAVDFRIYPRRHAKTESYGYSIMDAGVGAFVFANGLFSPWARLLPSFLRGCSSEVWIGRENVSRVIKSSAVLIVLGFLRLAVVKAANYQEHVSEYGVHGNFFFVLAGLRILSGCLDPVLNAGMISPSRIAFVLVVTQESLLRLFVEDWVVSVPTNRNGLPIILQNVELGASFLGYAAIYYSGIDFGLWIRGMHRGAERRPMLLLMALSVVILDLAYGLFPPSRRMVNAGYFAWTVVANWIQYSSCVVIEQFFVASVDQIKRKHDQSAQEPVMNCSSPFLMRFSYNALVLFLLGNVLTGVVNLSCNTLAANSTQAVLIILGYAVLLGLASEFMDLGKQETKNLFVRLKSRVGRRLQLS